MLARYALCVEEIVNQKENDAQDTWFHSVGLGQWSNDWLGIPLRSLEAKKVGLMCDWIVEQERQLEKVW